MPDTGKSNMDRLHDAKNGDRCLGFGVLLIVSAFLIGVAFEYTSGMLGWPAFAMALVSLMRFNDYRSRWKAVGGGKDGSGGIVPAGSTSAAGEQGSGRIRYFDPDTGRPFRRPADGGVGS